MTEVILIRHGQANSGAKNEADYDRLSGLGHQQAGWLGQHFRETGGFDRVISGTLRRQRETAEGLNLDARPHDTDPRLNEIDYFLLSKVLNDRSGVPFPTSAETFAAHIPQVLDMWRRGESDDLHESYDAFRTRILSVVQDAAAAGPGAVLVTSTGVIATLTAIALGLTPEIKARMFLRVGNTSVHKFEYSGDTLHLTQFGATPHLDRPDRHAARTHL